MKSMKKEEAARREKGKREEKENTKVRKLQLSV